MAIRSSSSGASSSQVKSFLSGFEGVQSRLRADQQDFDWQQGNVTDEQYIEMLRTRKLNATTPIDAQNIGQKIDTLQETMQRSQIMNDIDNGKKNYVDLVKFEQNLLGSMQPGSTSFNSQQKRVDSANQQVISLARSTLQQQIQNRQATPQDLAHFEKLSLGAFTPGTPGYETQLYSVQDAQRKADAYTYHQTTSVIDAKTEMQIQKAKQENNVAEVIQLSQGYAQELADRVQQNPQYFTNADGSFTADYYNLQSKVNSTMNGATQFSVTASQRAAEQGKKAFTDFKSEQDAKYNTKIKQIDNQIKNLQSDNGADAATTAATLAKLTQDKVEATNAYITGLSTAQQMAPDAQSALSVANVITDKSTALVDMTNQQKNYATLAQGGSGIIGEYDPKNNINNPVKVESFNEDGTLNPRGYLGNDSRGGILQDGSGKQSIMKGNDQVVSYSGANGAVDQYVSRNGVIYYRHLTSSDPNTGEFSKTAFKPLGNSQESVLQQMSSAEAAHPGLANNLGITGDQLTQIQQSAGEDSTPGTPAQPGTADYLAQNGSTQPQDPNNPEGPLVKDLKVKSSPDGLTGAGLQTIDLKGQNAVLGNQTKILTQQNQEKDQNIQSISTAKAQTESKLADLTAQHASAQDAIKALQASVNAGKNDLAKQLAAANANALKLQQTISTTQLQNTLLQKYVQGAATVEDLQKAGINVSQASTASGTALQPAATTPSVQNAGTGTAAVPNGTVNGQRWVNGVLQS